MPCLRGILLGQVIKLETTRRMLPRWQRLCLEPANLRHRLRGLK